MSENQENNQNTQPTNNASNTTNVATVQPNAQYQQQNSQYQQNVNYSNTQTIPNAYKPLSPWAYVGYNLLFSIPFIGFIMMIVFAFDNSNINRRNYSRSFFCAILIGLIISAILMVIIFGILGITFSSLDSASISKL